MPFRGQKYSKGEDLGVAEVFAEGGGSGLVVELYTATCLMEPNVHKHKHSVHTKVYFILCSALPFSLCLA